MIPPSIPVPDVLKGVDELIRIEFESFADSCFNSLLWMTGIVGFGVLLEGPEVFHEASIVFRRLFHVCKSDEHAPSWVTFLALLGWVLVAVGVAGEGIAEGFVSKADNIVRTFNDILLTDARTKTGVAFERAAAAYLKAEIARMRTAGLEKEAAELHKHNLELQALIQPRDLSPEEQKAIADALEPFRGKFVLLLEYQDPEAIRLSGLISHALTGGGEDSHPGSGPLNVQQSPLQEGITDPLRTGVEVTGDDQKFVKALRDALFLKGHLEPTPKLTRPRAFGGGFVFSPKVLKTPDATVYVGLKPLRFLRTNEPPK